MPSSMVHVRVDDETKTEAAAALAEMGLSVSDVVRVLLKLIAVEKAIPFHFRVPNAETREAMAEADEILRTRRARFATSAELLNDLDQTR